MPANNILVPYNFTAYDFKALEFVVRVFSHDAGAAITLFNAYVPPQKMDKNENSATRRIKGGLQHLSQRVRRQEEALEEAKRYLVRNGFSENRVRCLFVPKKKDTASDIIDRVHKHLFNVVILNNKPKKATRFFTGSVSTKVINALHHTTICIVT
jgi:hypothetical protein